VLIILELGEKMYLKAVEINGFKSFGDKVYIDFNRGITSIVGPNGSGKSNILDAVLWVLGEQSYKNIRAKESQDVIFSGGKEKKPATKAEVSLIIDNADRYLDLDNDTVKITRRIHISGENEYLINDTKSKLKEIGTLFLDTGIGKTAYSVIGQGKVERIINSSPKEVGQSGFRSAGYSGFRRLPQPGDEGFDWADESEIHRSVRRIHPARRHRHPPIRQLRPRRHAV